MEKPIFEFDTDAFVDLMNNMSKALEEMMSVDIRDLETGSVVSAMQIMAQQQSSASIMGQVRYPYPDGTTGSNRPGDGQIWTCSKSGDSWQWDDMLGQWFNVTNYPSQRQTYKQTAHQVLVGGGPLIIENIDLSKFEHTVYESSKMKCECGAKHTEFPDIHLRYCELYDINQ